METLVVLTSVCYVFDQMPKRTKTYKNTKILTQNASLQFEFSLPHLALQSLKRESERVISKRETWVFSNWLDMVDLPLI